MLEVSQKVEKNLNAILKKYTAEEGNIISLLQEIQDVFGYIPEKTVDWFSKRLDVPESRFFGVITFYSQFHLKPRGETVITACCGTACHVKGSDRLINSLLTKFSMPEGEDTTPDGKFTVEKVACVGACSIAPVLIVNKKVYGKVVPEKAASILKKFHDDKNTQ